jgi:hypothetical protein
MIDDPAYFYNHSRGILIYLINKKENKKFAFYKKIARPYEITDDHEQYIFKTPLAGSGESPNRRYSPRTPPFR